MSPTGLQLLGMLASGVRPVGGGGDRRIPDAALAQLGDGVSFSALLDRARTGQVSSGLPVTPEPELNIALGDEQTERLSQAVDRAHAAGAEHALVLMDGVGYRVDVETRRITGVVDPNGSAPITGIDTLVHAPPAGKPSNPIDLFPSAATLNSSLLDALTSAARSL